MSEVQRLSLEEDLTIYTAMSAKDKLLAALSECTQLDLDLSQVAEIDSAGFQLLVMAKREANRLAKPMHIVAHSPAVRELLDFYNSAAYFGDPLHIPAHEQA